MSGLRRSVAKWQQPPHQSPLPLIKELCVSCFEDATARRADGCALFSNDAARENLKTETSPYSQISKPLSTSSNF